MGYINRFRGDEFYTQYEDVARMLTQYLPKLREGRVICPFDTHESNFVRFLEDNGIMPEYSDNLDWTQFDYRDAYAVTNPAFSQLSRYVQVLLRDTRGSLTVVPVASIVNDHILHAICDGKLLAYDEGAPKRYLRPDGSLRQVSSYFVTDLGPNDANAGTVRRKSRTFDPPVMTDEGIPRYLRSSDVPDKWDGLIVVPCSFVPARYDASRHVLMRDVYRLHRNGHKMFAACGVMMRDASRDASCDA